MATGYAGANFREVLYLLNVSPQAQTLVLPEEAGKDYRLHPVLRADGATDRRVREAQYQSRKGRFVVPARTAVVFVVELEQPLPLAGELEGGEARNAELG